MNTTTIRTEQVCRFVDEKSARFIALSDRIFDLAELAWQETRSVEEQIQILEAEGFRVTRNVAGIPTAFMAETGSGGPLVGFLGEYDALANLSQRAGTAEATPLAPGGSGHGCGHNLLGVGSMMAAVAARDALAAAGREARIRYYGCPAEEGGAGKTFMIRDGVFKDLDVAFSWHPGMFTRVFSAETLAVVQTYFRFVGKASHAAGGPHLGRSALDAAELMNIGVNFLREHVSTEARLHYAFTDAGGTSPNVVQPQAELYYFVRAPRIKAAHELHKRVVRVAEGAAMMTDTTLTTVLAGAMTETLPNKPLEMALYEQMKRIGSPGFDEADFAFAENFRDTAISPEEIEACMEFFGIRTMFPKALHDEIVPFDGTPKKEIASTDTGDVSWNVPLAQLYSTCFAIGTPFHNWKLVAQGKSRMAHKGMVFAAKAMAATAVEAVQHPSLIEEAKAELRRKTASSPYVCPIPADTVCPALAK